MRGELVRRLSRKTGAGIVVVTVFAIACAVVVTKTRGPSKAEVAPPELAASELAKMPFAAARQALVTPHMNGTSATRLRADAAMRLGGVKRASHECSCSLNLLIDPGGVATRSVVVVTDDNLVVYSRDSGQVTDSRPVPRATDLDGSAVYVTSGDMDPHSGWVALGDSKGQVRAIRLDATGRFVGREPEIVTGGDKILSVAVAGNDLYWISDQPSVGRARYSAGAGWRVSPSRNVEYYGSRLNFTMASFARAPGSVAPPSTLVAVNSSGGLYRVSGLDTPLADQRPLQVSSSTSTSYPASALAAQVAVRGLEVAVGTVRGAVLYSGQDWTQSPQTRSLPQESRIDDVAFSANGIHLLTSSVDGVTVVDLTSVTRRPVHSFGGSANLGSMDSAGVTWAISEGRIIELQPTANRFRTLLPPTTAAAVVGADEVVLSEIAMPRNFASGSYAIQLDTFDISADLAGRPQPSRVDLERPYTADYFVNAASAGQSFIVKGGRSPDGQGTVWLWSASTKKLVKTMTLSDGDGPKGTPPDLVTRVLLDEHSRTVVAAAASGTVAAWNLDGKLLFRRAEGQVRALSLDGKRGVLSVLRPSGAEADSELALDRLDATNGNLKHTQMFKVAKPFMSTISPDGRLVLIQDEAGHLVEFRADNGKEIRSVDLPSVAISLAFSPDGKTIAYAKENNEIGFLTADLAASSVPSLDLQGSLALDVQWSADGKLLLANTGRFASVTAVPQGLVVFRVAELTSSSVLCQLMSGGIALPEGSENRRDRQVDRACE